MKSSAPLAAALAVAFISCLAACSQGPAQGGNAVPATAPAAAAITPVSTTAPAGDYHNDPAHSSLTFRVNHLGFSNYTARFSTFSARLRLDPAHPEASTLTAQIPVSSLTLNSPPDGFVEEMLGPMFFDSARYPQIDYQSTSVRLTSPNTARVIGNLTLHGVTRPVTLDVTFNGGYPGMSMDPSARIGFSARGTLRRSEFGMAAGIPAPGTTMGVGDQVEILIETEMSGPAFQQP